MPKPNLGLLRVLIHGANQNLTTLEKAALASFRVREVNWSRTRAQLEDEVKLTFHDVVIINHDTRESLKEVVELVRAEKDAANPYAIVLYVTASPSARLIRQALGYGVDGVIGLPFAPKDMWRQLSFFINNSRTFLRTGKYFGPCRRRLQGMQFHGPERRSDSGLDHQVAAI